MGTFNIINTQITSLDATIEQLWRQSSGLATPIKINTTEEIGDSGHAKALERNDRPAETIQANEATACTCLPSHRRIGYYQQIAPVWEKTHRPSGI
ncbi:MAG: hypothetical protein OHK0022_56570 [Roseiflexaceae bacterium]